MARIPAERFVWTDGRNLFGSEHMQSGSNTYTSRDDENAALILREISDALLRPVEHYKMATALSESLTELKNA